MNRILSDLSSLGWESWLRSLFAAGISAATGTIAANPLAAVFGTQQFTGRQLAIMAASSAIVAMAGILKKSPLPDRKIAIALLPGVHTTEQVEQIAQATTGAVPTAEVAAAILNPPSNGATKL